MASSIEPLVDLMGENVGENVELGEAASEAEFDTGGAAPAKARASFLTLVVPFTQQQKSLHVLGYIDTGKVTSTSAKGAAARALTKALRIRDMSHLKTGKNALIYVQRQSVSDKRQLQTMLFVGYLVQIATQLKEQFNKARTQSKKDKIKNIMNRNLSYKANVNSLNISRAEKTYGKNALNRNEASQQLAQERLEANKKIYEAQRKVVELQRAVERHFGPGV